MTTTERLVSSICPECGADIQSPLGQGQITCNYCNAGLAISDGLLVRLACPSCGGNFYYIDGSMCGSCPFCEAALLALTRHRVLRFVIRPQAEAPVSGASLRLLPFWRLTAMSMGWDFGTKSKIEVESGPRYGEDPNSSMPSVTRSDSGPQKNFRGRVVDVSLPDSATAALGVSSLRLRAAVFPVEAFSAEHEALGTIAPVILDVDSARERLLARALSWGSSIDGLKLECQRIDLIGSSLALLYYPFWFAGAGDAIQAWDAVNGEPEPLVSSSTPETASPQGAVFDDLRVIELKCGECGSPLPEGNRAVIFPCQKCGHFWVCEKEGLTPFRALYARPQIQQQRMFWLPFWQTEVTIRWRGQRASTISDLRRVLHVMQPRVDGPQPPDDAQLVYYAPAFGALRMPRLDFASRDLTRLQPQLQPGPVGEGELYHCFFGPEDAQALAHVVWLQLLTGAAARIVRTLRVETGATTLWYLPFGDQGREVVNLVSGVRYDRSAFLGVKH
jgi:predicted RNA-binding Zn-ribbon protein involved in translation (DUF1610 family)